MLLPHAVYCISNYINRWERQMRASRTSWWKFPKPRRCEWVRSKWSMIHEHKWCIETLNKKKLRNKKRNIHNPRLLCSCSVGISDPGSIKAPPEALSLRRITSWWCRQKRTKREAVRSSGAFRCDTNIQEGNPGITQGDVWVIISGGTSAWIPIQLWRCVRR